MFSFIFKSYVFIHSGMLGYQDHSIKDYFYYTNCSEQTGTTKCSGNFYSDTNMFNSKFKSNNSNNNITQAYFHHIKPADTFSLWY